MPVSELFGKYQMLTRIASGGMAEVWLARSSSLGGFEKLLAIKRMRPSLAHNQAFVSMFVEEAKLTVRLSHPNVVQVFDFGRVDDDYFIAMEYVEGVDLSTLAKRARRSGGLPIALSVYIMRSVFEGLSHAHGLGLRTHDPVIHRDVSPQNVLVSFDGHVKVTDFGIAKAASEIGETVRGEVFGKLAYVSPEQCRGEPVDEATDLWAAGVVLHELLTNRRLFARDSDLATMDAVEGGPIPRPRAHAPETPEALEDLVMAALTRDPGERLRSAREAAEALAIIQSTHFPEVTPYTLTDRIGELWGGELPRLLPAPPPRPTPTRNHRRPSVVQQTERLGAATAGLALSALDGVHQIRADSGWGDEATAVPTVPRSPAEDEAPTELPEPAKITALKQRFVARPDLWVLVDLGEAWLDAGEPRRAFGAFTLAAAKFAQGGLLVEAATIHRRMLERAPLDEPMREKIRRLPSLQGLSNAELLPLVLEDGDEHADYAEYRGLFELDPRPADVYAESPVLSSLNAEQLARVVAALGFRRLSPGEAVVEEGEAGDSFFLVGRGRLVVRAKDFSGRDIALTSLSDGDCFGEHSFFSGAPRSATVEASEPTWLLELERPTLNRVMQDQPTVRESLRRFYKERIAESLLAKSPLFCALDVKQRRGLAERFTFETYQAGDLVIREGDRSDAFYALKSGRVRVYTGDDDRPVELAQLGAGEIFGEIAALEGSVRTASVRALTACELLRLEAAELNAMLAKNAGIRRTIEAQIADRADAKMRRMIEEA